MYYFAHQILHSQILPNHNLSCNRYNAYSPFSTAASKRVLGQFHLKFGLFQCVIISSSHHDIALKLGGPAILSSRAEVSEF